MAVHCELGHEIRKNTDHYILDVEERSNTNNMCMLNFIYCLHSIMFFQSIEIRRACACGWISH